MIETINMPSYVSKMIQYEDFYQSLADQVFWDFDKSILNFANAYDLYEYAAYQYEHNKSIYNSLLPENLNKLRNLAFEQQWLFNTASGGSSVNAIAGKTLAGKMFSQLSHVSHPTPSSRPQSSLLCLFNCTLPQLMQFYLHTSSRLLKVLQADHYNL
jgi:hypothetical protein